jgi:hypothetical protein
MGGQVYFAQCRDHGRAFVETVMKLSSIKAGDLLSSLGNTSSLRTSLCHEVCVFVLFVYN